MLLTGFWVSNVFGQWSSDPNVNTLICNVNFAQLIPKTAGTSNGDTYITWFDNRSGNLDLYLQKLDINGNPQFATNGMLISSHTQSSWIGDYDIKVDANDNLIIAFSDKRNAGMSDTTVNPFVYKISSSGTFLWGANGVNLTNVVSYYQLWPKIALATDGNVFVTWWQLDTNTSSILTQKLNSNGVLQWANPYTIQGNPPGKNIYPNIVPSDNGNAILSWCYGPQGGGSFVPDIKTIFVRKINGSGIPVWTDSIFSRSTPDIPPYVVPQVLPDGNNGAFFSWYYSRNMNSLVSAVQRISSSGVLSFPSNGVDVSTDSTTDQVAPFISYDASGNIYSFWTILNLGETEYGMAGQKISPSGMRLWTDSGRTYIPLDTLNAPIDIITNTYNNNIYLTYITDSTGFNERIFGYSLDPNGNPNWGPVNISSILSLKYDMVSYVNQSGMSVYVWSDNRGSPSAAVGIWAQNVNADGTIGPVGIIQISSEIPDKFTLGQNYPNPFNPITKIKFDIARSGNVDISVFDMLGRKISTILNQSINPGIYSVDFDGSGLNSGVYFYRISANGFTEIKKMVLMK